VVMVDDYLGLLTHSISLHQNVGEVSILGVVTDIHYFLMLNIDNINSFKTICMQIIKLVDLDKLNFTSV